MKVATLPLALACLLAGGAFAEPPLTLVNASFMDVDSQLESAQGHPNEEWRLHGLKSYLGGHYDEAVQRFERAAWYADKHSQHYLSLIHWHGQGVPADRVQAYIWADLAAERGNRRLLAIREKMWAQLTPQQQRQAEVDGAAYYEKYGDAAAQPRAETEIRRFARGMTGSRLGYRNQKMDVAGGGPINGAFGNASAAMLASSLAAHGSTTGDVTYAEERVKLADYWRAQDAELDRGGRVELGPLTPTRRP